MNTVKFDNKDSYKDLGLLLQTKTRPKPAPKYNYVSLPARNGDLDLTEAFGDVIYNNLKYPLEFYLVDKIKNWDTKLSELTALLHGKKLKVTFSDDPNYYYVGRVTINELSSDRAVGLLSIDCNFEPYKYKQEETVVEYEVAAGNNYEFINSRMPVVPILELSQAMIIKFNDTSYSLNAGLQKALGIEFKEGVNVISVQEGTGTLKVTYREGAL